MRVSVITTVRHNVGDDFVREGILYLLSGIKPLDDVELIHKHRPATTVYGLENIRSLIASKVLDPLSRIAGVADRVESADLLIQSGAPIYWCHEGSVRIGNRHCGNSEWFGPLLKRRFLRDRRGRKFLNIAGGSCQRYHSDGSEIDSCPTCSNFIRELFDVCDLTLLRDQLAKSMLQRVGRDAAVLPCTSIFARDRMSLRPEDGRYIVLNFMENGGHYTLGQKIDGELWRTQFREIAQTVKKMGRVIVACHTPQEEQLAKQVVPDLETFLVPDEHIEYMKFYAGAIFGIVNRVHAGFMMASLGKPVAVIGTDSRALMLQNLNLPSYYVGEVSAVGVDAVIEGTRSRVAHYEEESQEIRRVAKEQYISAISAALRS